MHAHALPQPQQELAAPGGPEGTAWQAGHGRSHTSAGAGLFSYGAFHTAALQAEAEEPPAFSLSCPLELVAAASADEPGGSARALPLPRQLPRCPEGGPLQWLPQLQLQLSPAGRRLTVYPGSTGNSGNSPDPHLPLPPWAYRLPDIGGNWAAELELGPRSSEHPPPPPQQRPAAAAPVPVPCPGLARGPGAGPGPGPRPAQQASRSQPLPAPLQLQLPSMGPPQPQEAEAWWRQYMAHTNAPAAISAGSSPAAPASWLLGCPGPSSSSLSHEAHYQHHPQQGHGPVQAVAPALSLPLPAAWAMPPPAWPFLDVAPRAGEVLGGAPASAAARGGLDGPIPAGIKGEPLPELSGSGAALTAAVFAPLSVRRLQLARNQASSSGAHVQCAQTGPGSGPAPPPASASASAASDCTAFLCVPLPLAADARTAAAAAADALVLCAPPGPAGLLPSVGLGLSVGPGALLLGPKDFLDPWDLISDTEKDEEEEEEEEPGSAAAAPSPLSALSCTLQQLPRGLAAPGAGAFAGEGSGPSASRAAAVGEGGCEADDSIGDASFGAMLTSMDTFNSIGLFCFTDSAAGPHAGAAELALASAAAVSDTDDVARCAAPAAPAAAAARAPSDRRRPALWLCPKDAAAGASGAAGARGAARRSSRAGRCVPCRARSDLTPDLQLTCCDAGGNGAKRTCTTCSTIPRLLPTPVPAPPTPRPRPTQQVGCCAA